MRTGEFKTWKASFMRDHTESFLRSIAPDFQTPARNFKCMFHGETKGASLKYYEDSNTLQCFGKCGRTFNVFDLMALHKGINVEDHNAVWQQVIKPLYEHKNGNLRTDDYEPTTEVIPPPKLQQPAIEYPQAPALNPMGATVYKYSSSFVILRWDKADGSKNIRPYSWTPLDGWRSKDPKGLLPLYNKKELLANPSTPVLVVEGEKAAEAARKFAHGFVVTTWAHGTKSVNRTNWSPIHGRKVLLWADNDRAGVDAAKAIRELLQANVASGAYLKPTGKPHSGHDAADYLGTPDNKRDAPKGFNYSGDITAASAVFANYVRECTVPFTTANALQTTPTKREF